MPPDSSEITMHLREIAESRNKPSGTSFARSCGQVNHYLRTGKLFYEDLKEYSSYKWESCYPSSTLRPGSENLNRIDSLPFAFTTAVMALRVGIIKRAYHNANRAPA